MIFSKARIEHGCNKCHNRINRGDTHLVKQRYGYGTDRYCIPCVMEEITLSGHWIGEKPK